MFTQLCVGVNTLKRITSVRNEYTKPSGGFWTSTYIPNGRYASEWVEWVIGREHMDWFSNDTPSILLDVNDNARIFTINRLGDLGRIISMFPKEKQFLDTYREMLIDYEKASKDYDGIHLTSDGQWATRLTHPNLYGWDCESTLWFRNVFHNIRLYTGKLTRNWLIEDHINE